MSDKALSKEELEKMEDGTPGPWPFTSSRFKRAPLPIKKDDEEPVKPLFPHPGGPKCQ